MRYLGVLFICLAFILSTTIIYALPVDNIASPAIPKGLIAQDKDASFGIIFVPQAEIVTNAKLKEQMADPRYKFGGGKVGIVIGNKALLYGIAGMADAEHEYLTSGSEVEWHTDFDLAWGGGLTVILREVDTKYRTKGKLRAGVDIQYRHSDLDIEKVVLNDQKYKASDTTLTHAGFDYDQWQIALAASYQTGKFMPYGGIKYSDVNGDAEAVISGTTYRQVFDTDDNIGLFAGIDFLIGNASSVNFEARFVDEVAYSINGKIRF